jgi:hypothetical protein
MSHHPPTYSHSTDPFDADDWLKAVTKKLERAQCNDCKMVLYASGHLEGLASDWWDATLLLTLYLALSYGKSSWIDSVHTTFLLGC